MPKASYLLIRAIIPDETHSVDSQKVIEGSIVDFSCKLDLITSYLKEAAEPILL